MAVVDDQSAAAVVVADRGYRVVNPRRTDRSAAGLAELLREDSYGAHRAMQCSASA